MGGESDAFKKNNKEYAEFQSLDLKSYTELQDKIKKVNKKISNKYSSMNS